MSAVGAKLRSENINVGIRKYVSLYLKSWHSWAVIILIYIHFHTSVNELITHPLSGLLQVGSKDLPDLFLTTLGDAWYRPTSGRSFCLNVPVGTHHRSLLLIHRNKKIISNKTNAKWAKHISKGGSICISDLACDEVFEYSFISRKDVKLLSHAVCDDHASEDTVCSEEVRLMLTAWRRTTQLWAAWRRSRSPPASWPVSSPSCCRRRWAEARWSVHLWSAISSRTPYWSGSAWAQQKNHTVGEFKWLLCKVQTFKLSLSSIHQHVGASNKQILPGIQPTLVSNKQAGLKYN